MERDTQRERKIEGRERKIEHTKHAQTYLFHQREMVEHVEQDWLELRLPNHLNK